MSGFNLEEFRRGIPAVSRDGDVWVFDSLDKEKLFPLIAKCRNVRTAFTTTGHYPYGDKNGNDLIAMQYQDIDEERADIVAQNGNDGLHYDAVNHPKHYTNHPSGIECIQITEHMGFNLGNAVKYIWRADLKGDAIEDLKKAAWYINREIEKRSGK